MSRPLALCACYVESDGFGESLVFCRLHAAAPELLAALKDFASDDEPHSHPAERMGRARAAIAKAEAARISSANSAT